MLLGDSLSLGAVAAAVVVTRDVVPAVAEAALGWAAEEEARLERDVDLESVPVLFDKASPLFVEPVAAAEADCVGVLERCVISSKKASTDAASSASLALAPLLLLPLPAAAVVAAELASRVVLALPVDEEAAVGGGGGVYVSSESSSCITSSRLLLTRSPLRRVRSISLSRQPATRPTTEDRKRSSRARSRASSKAFAKLVQ